MNKSSNIIILHGWGLCGSKYNGLSDLLKKEGYSVFAPDLPGFGSEPLKSSYMVLSDYVIFLKQFIKKNKIEKPILIGHSFGGRIAIKYAMEYPDEISKIVLTGVPVIREKSFKKKLFFLAATIGNRIFSNKLRMKFRKGFYFLLGEWDYYKSGELKEVFKNIISEDLVGYLSRIKNPIFLIWGEEDRLTPASMILKIKKVVPQSKSIVIKSVGHKLPYQEPLLFTNALTSLL